MTIKKILIVEDELLIAKVLRLALEKKQYEVRLVNDEDTAIKTSSEFTPDLIILDIHLRNKSNGINAGKMIRANGCNSPIIFTTGNSYEQTIEAIKEIRNSHLFIKPVDTDHLIRFIETSAF